MAKSAFDISYVDLIKEHAHILQSIKKHYPERVRQGTMNEFVARKKIHMQETLLKMLKKHQKNPQLNLEDLFNQLK